MISVCIPTYNGEKYIFQQVQSILSQLEENDEVIISDDSSKDQTIEIIESFKDRRIKLLKNNNFHSPIFNMENALKNATGDYIFLADQDDVWLPYKIVNTVKYLEENDLTLSDGYLTDSNLNVIKDSIFEQYNRKKGLFNNLNKNSYMGCCMAFKKRILTIALPFPKDIPMHDIWIGFVAELFFKTVFIKKKLIFYRRHKKNNSSTCQKSQYNFFKKLEFRLNCIKYLPLLLVRKINISHKKK